MSRSVSTRSGRLTLLLLLTSALLVIGPRPAAGQVDVYVRREPQAGAVASPRQLEVIRVQPGSPASEPAGTDQERAESVRRAFRTVMDRYPPALARILRLDPTLMTNATYLAPYPELAAFLKGHPEVPRYADYYLDYAGIANYWEPVDPDVRLRDRAISTWNNVLTGLFVLSIFITIVLTLTWLIRFFVGHRRWLRAMQMQSDVHGRLMERFSSNDDLLAYVQSAAGRQFLQPLSAVADAMNAPSVAAPLGRILWSIQAALVLAATGVGLLVIRRYVMEEVGQMLLVVGVLVISLGVGFALAASASYLLSRRLGLFDGLRGGNTNSGVSS